MSEPTPVPSRRHVNPTLAARGLRPIAALATGRPCGTRTRYWAGCRCNPCRAANTAYERQRTAARARGEFNHVVSAEPARLHLVWLSAQGVGRKTAADAAHMPHSTVSRIIDRQKLKIRAQTEARILRVTPAAAADGAMVDATATWQRLDELLTQGYSSARLGSELLGKPVRALQISRHKVRVSTVQAVQRLHERLRRVPAEPTLARLGELSEEGFHRTRVARLLADAAALRRWDAPDMAVHRGLIAQRSAELVEALHAQLLAEEAA